MEYYEQAESIKEICSGDPSIDWMFGYRLMAVYVLSLLYAVYLIFATTTYALIFVKYVFTERRLSTSQGVRRGMINKIFLTFLTSIFKTVYGTVYPDEQFLIPGQFWDIKMHNND